MHIKIRRHRVKTKKKKISEGEVQGYICFKLESDEDRLRRWDTRWWSVWLIVVGFAT